MYLGVIYTFKAFYLVMTLEGIAEMIRVFYNVRLRDDCRACAMKGVSNISAA
jgi:hypothetical protein